MKEYDGFYGNTSPRSRLRSIYREIREDFGYDPDRFHAAFIVFSATERQKSAFRFIDWLKRQNLGRVMATKATRNPNTGSKVTVWLWTIKPKKFEQWYKEK